MPIIAPAISLRKGVSHYRKPACLAESGLLKDRRRPESRISTRSRY